MVPHKPDVLAALLSQVRDELATHESLTKMAIDEATSSESRAENKYDTRATEASYLAAGQGQRLLALRWLVSFLESRDGGPGPPDLYVLEGEAGTSCYLLAPDGGGRRVRVQGQEVVVVTSASPVGSALSASHAGDTVRIGAATLEVISIG